LTNTVLALVPLTTSTDPMFTLTDGNGNYLFYTLSDFHVMEVFNPEYFANGSLVINVPCYQIVTNNAAFTNGTVWVAGRVTDSATGLGIGGLLMDVNATNNYGMAAFTDTNGNYAIHVSTNVSSIWRPRPDKVGLSQRGYVPPANRTNVIVSSANVSNVNFSIQKANALAYGVVRDNYFNPVADMNFHAGDSAGIFDPRGASIQPNGSYSVGVLGGTNWTLAPDTASMTARGYAAGAFFPFFIGAGQATNVSFVIARTNVATLGTPVRISNNQFQMLLSGMAGGNYVIVESTNVASTNWSTVISTNAPCNSFYVVDSQATNSARFYRAIVVP
jgi:hypothetical protein